ncbi:MAG: hypothetical protein NTZ68_03760 [Candidatus Dependentiae bacterium]|nr:hypothetical protein [Candidatus Dependentiae bacterium]
MILVFLSTLSSMRPSFSGDDMCDVSRRLQKIVEKLETSDEAQQEEEKLLKEEEKFLKELWDILGRFYTKIIEITALYCSGYYPDSYTLYDQILVGVGRDAMHLGKIVAWHIPKLVSNPHVPVRVKIKKCAYAASAVVIVVLWMKELYKYNKNKQKRDLRRPQLEREHNFYGSDHGSDYLGVGYGGGLSESVDVRPRLGPRDF